MKLGCHQPNFVPWLSYFHKIQKSDVFVVMIHCQFEKNNFQNRFNLDEKWITKPVTGGMTTIKDKFYTDGNKLIDVNMPLIIGFCKMLSINTSKIHYDFETKNKGTERIIEICKRFQCDEYLTNPDSMNKYLDEKLMNDNAIEVVGCELPKQYRVPLFTALETWGVQGCINIIQKDWSKCKA
ncbi:WbqC family protein [Candidatus Parcubacteria bacterium]|nr:WbqC family protein [Candidatus Parcubacteria bacterium]